MSWTLNISDREFCDLELILDGAMAPLTGFMCEQDYRSCIEKCRLADNSVWPMPIVLGSDFELEIDSEIQLAYDGQCVASMTVESVYKPDIDGECEHIYRTTDVVHPGVHDLLSGLRNFYIGGTVRPLNGGPKALYCDFRAMRLNTAQVKTRFQELGWRTVVGFQTRNPTHNSHLALMVNAAKTVNADGVLLHPTVGPTQATDIDYATRLRCYQEVVKENSGLLELAVIPIAMRMAGPREALWHAILRRNYGCTHFIMGRDPAGPSVKRSDNGETFYGPYDAHELVNSFTAEELGIQIIKSAEVGYYPQLKAFYACDAPEVKGLHAENISGTQLRDMIRTGQRIPEWFTPAGVADVLQASQSKGCCVYLTGLSGAGKSTIAEALNIRLQEHYPAHMITVLDGDEIRTNLSKGLGFSREDRSANVRRIGYVAKLLVRTGGIVLCANIAPYADDREWNRKQITEVGRYVEVYVNTSLEVCEKRDVKGLYAKARDGTIPLFTGVTDPFEVPQNPELTLDTAKLSLDECLEQILKTILL